MSLFFTLKSLPNASSPIRGTNGRMIKLVPTPYTYPSRPWPTLECLFVVVF